jgi:hypothetical protein
MLLPANSSNTAIARRMLFGGEVLSRSLHPRQLLIAASDDGAGDAGRGGGDLDPGAKTGFAASGSLRDSSTRPRP